jgi:ribosome modulation factor
MSDTEYVDQASQPASNVTNETILWFTHELMRSKRRLDEANSAHRHLVKQAKTDGVPTDAVLESIRLSRMEDRERRQRLVDRTRIEAIRYPESGQLLLDLIIHADVRVTDAMRHTDQLADAEQKGYIAGKNGTPLDDCPYQEGTESAALWRQHWGQGHAAAGVQAGEHGKQASTQRRPRQPRIRIVAEEPTNGGEAPRTRRRRRQDAPEEAPQAP